MMPGAAALAINQVQLWNECNKMAIFGGAGAGVFHVTLVKGSVRFVFIVSLELTHPRTC